MNYALDTKSLNVVIIDKIGKFVLKNVRNAYIALFSVVYFF